MRNVAYKGIETAVSLLLTYEAIALAHRKREEEETLSDGQMNFRHSFVLLILNASIIEGTLRSILSERLLQDIRIATEMERKLGHAILTKTERSLSERHSDLEMQGGWEKLKEHYSFYFDRSLNKAFKKDLWEAIEVLFVLRNVLSHGTAIVQSDVKMGETMKDMYPYNWQTKLQRASVYLDKVFSKSDVFHNLATYSVPQHFMGKTQELFLVVEQDFGPLPDRVDRTIRLIKNYSFGYRLPAI